ncbi:response regulator [Anabaena sp. UHCC 0204]|uniref:hybrid sensor histidine kinase/response regulator n=1 Tax=Anabaena sp. UHCC 0204 TaxID=2590009 RepID=UPI0014463FEE|nr:response regulator [Anabaena sp. UHCC 0204]MTJ08957.1 hybrid sensor histidine kinase/response regulator [Anabaena sp. UHCC 0204]
MKTILIIEDETQIRNNIREILHLSDFDTLVAENGLQGLELAKNKHPDLIICDLMMPELDGYGVLTQLRQNSSTATMPLIFLTAKSEWSDVRRGMELGADDYLTKPFQPHELLQAITARLDKKSIADQQIQQKLNDLSSAISHSLPHEINTPLNHIIGLSNLLIQEQGMLANEENLEMLNLIHQAGLRIHKLTLNFLMYADMELISSDPAKIAAIRNNGVKSFVKSDIENVAVKIAQESNRLADLSIEISDAMVKISPAKLSKIAEEIIDNAFKFSQPNTPIKIIGHSIENTFHLYIIDYGRGMTHEEIANVGAYVQFGRKIYEQRGSGLGLLIAKRLVELHGGEFSIESIYGKQTIIRIVLLQ